MTTGTINTLVTVGGTLLGALVGAFISYMTTKRIKRKNAKICFKAINEMAKAFRITMDTSVSFAKNHTCILYRSSVVLPWEFILSVSNFNSEAFLLYVKFKQLLNNYNNLMHELKGGPIQYPHKYHTMWQQSWEKIINISNILDEYLEEFSRLNP